MRTARWLRFDHLTWARFGATSAVSSGAVIVLGAFGVIAWNRFGFQALLAPRASLRILLLGLYGWLGLSGLAWLAGRWLLGEEADWNGVVKLFGLAHLPVVLVALAGQVTGVLFDFSGPGWVVAMFAALVWMPGQLVAATREAFRIDTTRALALTAGPYLIWLATVGWLAMRQMGHLL